MRKSMLLAALCLLLPVTVSAQTVYYNTEGGRYYHADSRYDAISERYWDSMAELTEEQALQKGLEGPCQRCFKKEAASPSEKAMSGFPKALEYSQEERAFFEACFEHACHHMPDPDRSDPEYVYRNQAKHCDELSEAGRAHYAQENMLWGWAGENDIPRDEALMIGYAALDQIAKIPKEEMSQYYADAWMNISDPDRRLWQVHMSMAAEYRKLQQDADSYIVYVDAGTGEVVDMTRY